MARMQKEQSANREGFVKRSMAGLIKTGPDVSTAARSGDPTMTPASESGDETIGFAFQPNVGGATTSSIGSTATVQTITPGSANALPPPAPDAAPASTDAAPASSDTTPAADAAQPASTTTPATPADTSQESTSKKKSGLRKIIPF